MYLFIYLFIDLYVLFIDSYIYIYMMHQLREQIYLYIYTYIAYNNITKVAMPSLISRDIYMYMHIKKPSLQVAISHI
jgi:hypothetical protein